MEKQSSMQYTKNLESKVLNFGQDIVRRNRNMREILSFSKTLTKDEVKDFKHRDEEYQQYREMILDQVTIFTRYYNLDRMSRRLMIQFPINWYEDKEEDYTPCPESFMVQYVDVYGYEYDIILNERSTEVSRASEDISVILRICDEVLHLEGNLRYFK